MGRNFVIGVQWTHGLLSPKGAQCGCVLTRLGYIGVVQEGNSKDTIASEELCEQKREYVDTYTSSK